MRNFFFFFIFGRGVSHFPACWHFFLLHSLCVQSRKRLCLSKQPCKGPVSEERRCDQQECENRVERAGSLSQRDSCQTRCGQTAPLGQCQCSPECETFGDCCRDFAAVCSVAAPTTIANVVVTTTAPPSTLSPTLATPTVRPVAASAATSAPLAVSDGATDADLADFGERLLALDENNVADKIVLNTGCTTRVGNPNDCSSNRLFEKVIFENIFFMNSFLPCE